jgi:tRNA (adenine22-N1)-methyltransferase
MISLKLKAIAFFIEKDDRVVDIGCDHAYLDIYLSKNNLCKNVIASDINPNALNLAISNIKKNGLNKKIKCILSDGLNDINVKNTDTIVIAGMGTKTIKHILSNKEKLRNINKIIISSNNDHYELRKYMQKNNYKLIEEKIIFEKKHYYIISKYIKGKQKLSNKELMFGIYKKENEKYYKYLFLENKKILQKIPITKIKARHKIKKENKILKKRIYAK